MKIVFIYSVGVAFLFLSAVMSWQFLYPHELTNKIADIASSTALQIPQKSKEELIAEALEKSKDIRGLYMTADVANDQGRGGTRLRNNIIRLAEQTEINGIVIDVKEVCGPDYNESALKSLLDELHKKNIWAIGRMVAFKDASQIDAHPEWYLKRETPKKIPNEGCVYKQHLRAKASEGQKNSVNLWQDNKGGYWMDPASIGAREYLVFVGKKMIDLGFDELQFDYVRFPSDGDVQKAIYPAWDGKTPKYIVMKSFFEYVNKNLKGYRPDIILSADMFGYAAIHAGDVGIGQRLDDIGDNFDYVSFMVYPSHYYSGLYLPAYPAKNLPAVSLDKNGARRHPDTVVYRSMIFAREFLDGRISTSTYTSFSHTASTTETVANPTSRSHVRLRPWLEDFFHEADKSLGNPYGVQKVRLQIDAAEKAEPHGWLIWNASNNYTEGALVK